MVRGRSSCRFRKVLRRWIGRNGPPCATWPTIGPCGSLRRKLAPDSSGNSGPGRLSRQRAAIMSEIATPGAVLAVTHDFALMPFADRIIYIEDGALKDKEPANASVYPACVPEGRLSSTNAEV